jgi:hypothetical protein
VGAMLFFLTIVGAVLFFLTIVGVVLFFLTIVGGARIKMEKNLGVHCAFSRPPEICEQPPCSPGCTSKPTSRN